MNLCDYSEITALLSRHDFRFSKSKGQNFLIRSWVPERIAEESSVSRETGVVEIGPGVGCLTERLCERAGHVCAVELDRALIPVLGETMARFRNFTLVEGDALKTDFKRLVAERLPGLVPAVCANLPYNITSPVISALLDSKCFESITVMVQKEVAERICAKPGSPEYGAFTVYVNFHAKPSTLFTVGPDCFMPRPKVISAVLNLSVRSAPPVPVLDERLFFRVVRAAFGQRRKTLLNALSAGLSDRVSRAALKDAAAAAGHGENIRGEVLSIEAFADLSNRIYKIINSAY